MISITGIVTTAVACGWWTGGQFIANSFYLNCLCKCFSQLSFSVISVFHQVITLFVGYGAHCTVIKHKWRMLNGECVFHTGHRPTGRWSKP